MVLVSLIIDVHFMIIVLICYHHRTEFDVSVAITSKDVVPSSIHALHRPLELVRDDSKEALTRYRYSCTDKDQVIFVGNQLQ
jgi:hypothetical protein